MKYAFSPARLALLLLPTFGLASGAIATTCVNGVYRAGCAGPRGAVAVRKPYAGPPPAVVVRRPVAPPPPRAVVVAPAPRCAFVNGVRVCR